MNLHYSLYRTQHEDSDPAIIDLSQVTSMELLTDHVRIGMQDLCQTFTIDHEECECFLTAWNRYKYANSAAKLIKTPEIQNPTIACNSAFRIDEFLGFLAGERLKELQAIEPKP